MEQPRGRQNARVAPGLAAVRHRDWRHSSNGALGGDRSRRGQDVPATDVQPAHDSVMDVLNPVARPPRGGEVSTPACVFAGCRPFACRSPAITKSDGCRPRVGCLLWGWVHRTRHSERQSPTGHAQCLVLQGPLFSRLRL